jgi:hypothetical protein
MEEDYERRISGMQIAEAIDYLDDLLIRRLKEGKVVQSLMDFIHNFVTKKSQYPTWIGIVAAYGTVEQILYMLGKQNISRGIVIVEVITSAREIDEDRLVLVLQILSNYTNNPSEDIAWTYFKERNRIVLPLTITEREVVSFLLDYFQIDVEEVIDEMRDGTIRRTLVNSLDQV